MGPQVTIEIAELQNKTVNPSAFRFFCSWLLSPSRNPPGWNQTKTGAGSSLFASLFWAGQKSRKFLSCFVSYAMSHYGAASSETLLKNFQITSATSVSNSRLPGTLCPKFLIL